MENRKIEELLSRGVAEIIDKENLISKLRQGKSLRIKHGIDPTTSDLHIGHSVVYHKLRAFQELGHKIVIIIGDFTARFGDPTGKLTARTFRTKEETRKKAKNYKKQLGKILDISKVEFRYNSEWYDKMSLDELLRIAGNFTVHQMLERDMFKQRIKEKKAILIPELIYPILQGYDSVVVKSDATVIGIDQLFNEMQGRMLQQAFGQSPQAIIAVPLLIGLDGQQKMSQSIGNYVGFEDEPKEMYGKIMSLPDKLLQDYFLLTTRIAQSEIEKILQKKPIDAKKRLAFEIVKIYHSEKQALEAEKFFEEVFQKKELPKGLVPVKAEKGSLLLDILSSEKIASKSELRRLFSQGAIEVNGRRIKDNRFILKESSIVKIGKKKFLNIVV